jgi:hypothetical protein
VAVLTRDAILSAEDLKRVEVEVPEWGGSVYVYTMTARERDRFEDTYRKRKGHDIRAPLAVICCRDEAGNRLFRDADVEDLSRKSSAALGRIFNAISELNFITPKDAEELEGNSAGDPSDS